MTVVRRVGIVLATATAVAVGWLLVAQTPWAGSVDAVTAGEGFSHPVEALREIAGSLLVAIPATLLVRSTWGWFSANVLGREPRTRIAVRPHEHR